MGTQVIIKRLLDIWLVRYQASVISKYLKVSRWASIVKSASVGQHFNEPAVPSGTPIFLSFQGWQLIHHCISPLWIYWYVQSHYSPRVSIIRTILPLLGDFISTHWFIRYLSCKLSKKKIHLICLIFKFL